MSSSAYKREHYHQIGFLYPTEEYEDLLEAVRDSGETIGEYLRKAAISRMAAEDHGPRKWFLIEDCTKSKCEVYHTALTAAKRDAAIREGVAIWESLTRFDQSQREECYICKARPDQWGDPDLESATDFIDIREASQS